MDYWTTRSNDLSCITMDFAGVLEVDLTARVNYDVIYEHFYELMIFMQLYSPDKFEIDKIEVSIGKKLFQLGFPPFNFFQLRKNVRRTVDDCLLNFLAKCYVNIPCRKSKQQIRNIPYIVLKTSRGLEDNFLMFYRFIECYYKHAVPEMKNKFISQSIIDHYKQKDQLTELQLEKYTQEIISLRNHYVHAGYFIRNSSLRITFEKVDKKANPKNYTANDVDFKWIYDRTKILYLVAIDIIFRNMLGYSDYCFTKHF